MRAILLALLVLGATVLTFETPEAAACTGDPSVCGVKRSADCTTRDGAVTTSDLDRCWSWL